MARWAAIGRALAWCGLVLLGLPLVPAGAQERLPPPVARVLVNDAPPYRIITHPQDQAPRYGGIYVDILHALAAEIGLELVFIAAPYARAFSMMEGGEGDIMLGPNRSAAREAYLYYLQPPLPTEAKAVIQRKDASPIARYEDLHGLQIAVLRGAAYFDPFDSDATLAKVPVGDYETALRMLAWRRIDAVVIPGLQAAWQLRQLEADLRSGLRLAPFTAPGRDSYIVMSRRSPLLPWAGRLEAALQNLKEGGGIQRVVGSYEQR